MTFPEFQLFVARQFPFLNNEIAIEKSYFVALKKTKPPLALKRFGVLLKNLLLFNRVLQMFAASNVTHRSAFLIVLNFKFSRICVDLFSDALTLPEFTTALKLLKPGYEKLSEEEAPAAVELCFVGLSVALFKYY